MHSAAQCPALATDTMTPASDLTLPASVATTYSKMSVEIFNKFNLLLTNPTVEKVLYSPAAQTAVTSAFTAPRAALKWS